MNTESINNILYVNAHLKFVEYLLHEFDTNASELTLGELRENFKKKFGETGHLLDQYFGIYRLIPLILMKQVNLDTGEPLSGDFKTTKIIRDSIAHNDFSISEEGYKFGGLTLSFSKFNEYIHRVENNFNTKHIRPLIQAPK